QVIRPAAGVTELREAETALRSMQLQLTQLLRQKERMAALGGAVARISHDLRNMLTTAQLMADRLETSDDPAVQRTAPKLLSSLARAANLCESTLAFGRAEEPAPNLADVALVPLVEDVIEAERYACEGDLVRFVMAVPPEARARLDAEQIYRVIANLVRNARQAIEASGRAGVIRVSVSLEGNDCVILIADTGPGLPEKLRETLFKPFHGTSRKGGSGLGLAIAAELVRGHGGRLDLVQSGPGGTEFAIRLPSGGSGAAG
ncbi:MAG: sensor histidine kinase, partial [Alphaproteobacteria bacterium HGW-Alphaproteobacteria-2]